MIFFPFPSPLIIQPTLYFLGSTKVQMAAYHEVISNKRDCKAMYIIHQCVNSTNFENIMFVSPAKEAC